MSLYKFLFIILAFLAYGCAGEHGLPGQSGRNMADLEREAQEVCDDLVRGIAPGSVQMTWNDNRHPHSPMLSEVYVVSVFKRRLSTLGFEVVTSGQETDYMLRINMTPCEKSLLVLAGMYHEDKVITTREAYLSNSSKQWNNALSSYRYKTDTRIPLRSAP